MDVFAIALSGMQAAQAQLNDTAQNTANLNTPGYKSQRADLVELSTGGVGVARTTSDPSPGPTLPDGSEGSNVDPASQMIDLQQEKLLYDANATVIRTADRMTGTLLDMVDRRRGASES